MAELSPMMKQYFEIKNQYQNCILFYRLGDFYEMFYDDAKTASRELELTLTGRDCGQEERAPMCGVPFHSYESYVARLVAKGYKVAICEQLEDPAAAKGIVKRGIIRVITPGTVMEGSMLDETKNNFLASVYDTGEKVGVCFSDISTGEVYGTILELSADSSTVDVQLQNELSRYRPTEILINQKLLDRTEISKFIKQRLSASVELLEDEDFEIISAQKTVLKQFHTETLQSIGLQENDPLIPALGAFFAYLKRTQITGLERISTFSLYSGSQYMKLDMTACKNLELTENMRTLGKKGSLLGVLDKTCTAMGKRLIRSWLERPLVGYQQIICRLNAVEELLDDTILRADLREKMSTIHDLERLMTRIVYGSANARDLRSLCSAVEVLPSLRESMDGRKSLLLQQLYQDMDALEDIHIVIDASIIEEPPMTVREGGMIREGYYEVLDQLRNDMTDGKGIVARIEAQERERYGIKTLKVGYNRVFGYYIEVPNGSRDMVPDCYIRKQTLANCERYITQELKELEGRILGAKDKAAELEYHLFEEVRQRVAQQLERVQKTAEAVAVLDVLCSFAEVSFKNHYCRPEINMSGRICLRESRHPVVEELLNGRPFVPNDVLLDRDENRIAIITGPNMAGKSTYMRQTALIVLMAQCGCFVPATSAEIGIVDSIFTRVGASDDLTTGQSTFMVEMSEVAHILKCATENSLLILDEIGRGTSTFDGMSIARSVLEYVADKKKLGAKALFSTHYHELTEMESMIKGVKNYNIAVKRHGDDITFLRRIVRGGADDSYGILVAKLAGLPESVISRAKKILAELENGGVPQSARPIAEKENAVAEPEQLSMIAPAEKEIMEQLQTMDINVLTPIESMNILFELWKKANNR